jgi:hypothetical protein
MTAKRPCSSRSSTLHYLHVHQPDAEDGEPCQQRVRVNTDLHQAFRWCSHLMLQSPVEALVWPRLFGGTREGQRGLTLLRKSAISFISDAQRCADKPTSNPTRMRMLCCS